MQGNWYKKKMRGWHNHPSRRNNMAKSVEILNYKRQVKVNFEHAVQVLMAEALTVDSNSIEKIRKLALKAKKARQEYRASLKM